MNEPKPRWYQRTESILIAILFIGPFALPMVWANPRYSRTKKIVATAAVIALTLVLMFYTEAAVRFIEDRMLKTIQAS